MAFIDPDELGKAPTGATPAMVQGVGNFIDPDSLSSGGPSRSAPTTSLIGQGKKMVQDVGGFAQAGMDLAGSVPAFAYGTPGFVDEVIRNKNPKEAFDTLMQFASDHNLLNLLPKDLTALRDTEG